MTSGQKDSFGRLGFQVWHCPGVSRAWRRILPAGDSVLITDVGGFDLPERGGPYAALLLSPRDELVEFEPFFERLGDLVHWIRHTERRVSVRPQLPQLNIHR